MKKILLAVIGSALEQKTLRYALQLSQQIKVELEVLQVLRSQDKNPAFIEKNGVYYQRTVCNGNPASAISNYVDINRNVIFTIYDASSSAWKRKKKIPKEIKKMSVPLVVVTA